ncbi:hypothetical protein FB45DRAFT_874676 [Roridomyces roridus]|uniref:NAD(P)-binding protein n=1 Tax=Roridomyces roridus TaxID=1738132 RepID=A0AAD7B894_9AGAR|nr:hypothetical protein FB45DRAFT_874676 [Roridomyces roridus]
MKLSFPLFLKHQLTRQAPVVKADLKGKTVLVLGANAGIGFEATKHFATMNPGRLILACRSQSRGQEALETGSRYAEVKKETGCSVAELWLVDLADFASVKAFADRFDKDGGRLDILVANAGVNPSKYEVTKDGWEAALQVNDLSTPLFSLLLLPHLLRTASEHGVVPRLVVVGSEVHYWAEFPRRLLDSGEILRTLGSQQFCTDKHSTHDDIVLNVLFVRALNDHLPPSTPLITNVVNPGLCSSELNRDLKGPGAVIFSLIIKLIGFTSEQGSRRLVHAAVGNPENPDSLRGQFLDECRVYEPSDWVISAEGRKAQELIWNELLQTLGQVDARVLDVAEKYLTRSA